MVRLASILVYVEFCWLEKGPAVPGLPAQVTLLIPRVFPCQQSSFCAGSPGSLSLPANLCEDDWITASQQHVLSLGNWALCLIRNGLQVSSDTACHPSLASQASRLSSSRVRKDIHSSNRSGSGISSSFVRTSVCLTLHSTTSFPVAKMFWSRCFSFSKSPVSAKGEINYCQPVSPQGGAWPHRFPANDATGSVTLTTAHPQTELQALHGRTEPTKLTSEV